MVSSWVSRATKVVETGFQFFVARRRFICMLISSSWLVSLDPMSLAVPFRFGRYTYCTRGFYGKATELLRASLAYG
jgi:hypothetical protein